MSDEQRMMEIVVNGRWKGFLLLLLPIMPVHVFAQNMLVNPGFEKDNGYGQAEGWWYYGGAGRAAWARRNGAAGSSFYPAGNVTGGFGQDVLLEDGKPMDLVFVIHGKMEPNYSNINTTVAVEFWDGDSLLDSVVTNVYEYLSAHRNQWVPVTVRPGRVPTQARFVKVRCDYADGIVPDGAALATCQWDDARLFDELIVPVAASPAAVVAPIRPPSPGVGQEVDAPGSPFGNLAPNPSFESVAEGVPDQWFYFSNRGKKIEATDRMARTGRSAVRMETPEQAGGFQGMYCTIQVEEGRDYRFEVYARNDSEARLAGTAQGNLVIEWLDADSVEVGRDVIDSWDSRLSRLRWETIRIGRAKAPRGAVKARFGIHLSGGPRGGKGAVFLDDAQIYSL